MDINQVLLVMQEIADDRNISKDIIIEALQDSLMKAYRRQIGVPDALVDVEIDETSGNMRLFHKFEVVAEVTDDELEVGIDEITDKDHSLQVGDFYRVEQSIEELGRAAATLAKNVIKQKLREAEKQGIYDEYIGQLGDMIMGQIESVEEKFVVLNIGRSLAVMPRAAQIDNEYYREGQNIRVVITEVNKDTKGAQILVSRADAMLVRRLFETEVPEIYSGEVEIKAIAREAGDRTKVAVYATDSDIDPIGACIGPRGTRVQAIIEELKGEKIDIFEWSEDMIELIKNALSPAEIVAVFPNAEAKGLVVVVDDSQLSLAIGKRGKNARLAVRLTKLRIDIKSVTEMTEAGVDYMGLMAIYQDELNAAQVAREVVAEVEEVIETVEDVVETEAIVEAVEETVEEAIIQDVVEDAVEAVEETIVEEVVEAAEEAVEEEVVEVERADIFKPRTEYVSKFETLADASRAQDQQPARRRWKKDTREEEKPVNTAELLKELDYEIAPEYSEEELEQIAQTQAENESSWIEDDIDFDEYDEYYDAE